ncbi:ROK family transcriptional regulator [Salinibacterium hongtaonis]|uniref:ROK family transcriptional regulator n=1 Tax=Homoserinimonas hongtaonis TaxID=2079791 RepID=UPI000D38CE54|nr:ROK family transcriptional regulator [Salinibacterium hongtaonis]AWB89905.1 transcriptional regulator [Salinibacterium hongtaonis]
MTPRSSAASLDDVRRHNLGRIVEIVHHSGAISRSQLTRATGLNRSTISALVGELVAAGLVSEADPTGDRRVGRPSPVVSAGASAVAFAVHAELDSITVGLVQLGGVVIAKLRVDVDQVPTAESAVEVAAALIERLSHEHGVERSAGVGVAVPGLVRDGDGVVRLAPHLLWRDAPIERMLSRATNLPVSVANDATLGARAERTFGAGRGVDDLVYLNGGASGIGGGIVLGGRTLTGLSGYAGEFGHAFSTDAGAALEDLVDRASLTAALGVAAPTDAELEMALAASTDAEVAQLVARQATTLGRGLAGTINILNPAAVILGGFLGVIFDCAPEHLLAAVREHTLAPAFDDVSVARAQLGDNLLMIGAGELAFDRCISNPLGALRAQK